MNYTSLVMVKKHVVGKYTLNNCVTYCLQHWPDHAYVLISYDDNFLIKDDYKCMCAHKENFQNNKRLKEYKCDQFCLESKDKYR